MGCSAAADAVAALEGWCNRPQTVAVAVPSELPDIGGDYRNRWLHCSALVCVFCSIPDVFYFSPHGYQPMHISSVQRHGAQMALTSLHRDGAVTVLADGNSFTADSSIEIDDPATWRREKERK
uniref:Uncharacterized protein n=1 Tax=Anopheles merus TaxID=30066 RepID=A0A182VLP0_ANOME